MTPEQMLAYLLKLGEVNPGESGPPESTGGGGPITSVPPVVTGGNPPSTTNPPPVGGGPINSVPPVTNTGSGPAPVISPLTFAGQMGMKVLGRTGHIPGYEGFLPGSGSSVTAMPKSYAAAGGFTRKDAAAGEGGITTNPDPTNGGTTNPGTTTTVDPNKPGFEFKPWRPSGMTDTPYNVKYGGVQAPYGSLGEQIASAMSGFNILTPAAYANITKPMGPTKFGIDPKTIAGNPFTGGGGGGLPPPGPGGPGGTPPGGGYVGPPGPPETLPPWHTSPGAPPGTMNPTPATGPGGRPIGTGSMPPPTPGDGDLTRLARGTPAGNTARPGNGGVTSAAPTINPSPRMGQGGVPANQLPVGVPGMPAANFQAPKPSAGGAGGLTWEQIARMVDPRTSYTESLNLAGGNATLNSQIANAYGGSMGGGTGMNDPGFQAAQAALNQPGAYGGQWIGDKSPEALAYMLANGQAVKGNDGRYYVPGTIPK